MLKKKEKKNIEEDSKKVIEKTETEDIQEETKQKNKVEKPKKKKFIIIGIILTVLLILGGVVFYLINDSILSRGYTTDQMKVKNAFGIPEAFTYVKHDSEEIEVWKYIELGEMFTFKNGDFALREHHNFNVPDGQDVYHLDIEPSYYYRIDDINQLIADLEATPNILGNVDDSLLSGETKFYAFDDYLHVGELDGKVVYINQKALITSGDMGKTDVTQDLSDYVHTNDEYGFSFEMGDYSEKILEKETDFGQDYTSYTYCYVSTLAEDDEYCGQDSYPIFSIDVMNEDQYQENIVNGMFGDLYTELGSDDTYYFMYSHPNGDLPSDAPPNLLKDTLVDTFEVKGGN